MRRTNIIKDWWVLTGADHSREVNISPFTLYLELWSCLYRLCRVRVSWSRMISHLFLSSNQIWDRPGLDLSLSCDSSDGCDCCDGLGSISIDMMVDGWCVEWGTTGPGQPPSAYYISMILISRLSESYLIDTRTPHNGNILDTFQI